MLDNLDLLRGQRLIEGLGEHFVDRLRPEFLVRGLSERTPERPVGVLQARIPRIADVPDGDRRGHVLGNALKVAALRGVSRDESGTLGAHMREVLIAHRPAIEPTFPGLLGQRAARN